MKLNEIRTFVAVADARSVQGAAKILNTTQSAVSRLVQRLESDLGVDLFNRQTKPLTLTGDGEVAIEHARRVLASAGAFADAFSISSEPSGLLKIGAAHALAALMAGKPLDELRSKFPDLSVQVTSDWTGPLVDRVSGSTLDAALILLPLASKPKGDLHARRIGDEDIRIIGATRFATRRLRSIREINETGWVLQPDGCGYRAALTQSLERVGAGAPQIIMEAFGHDLQLSVIARGVGFGLLPARLLENGRYSGQVRVIHVSDFRLAVSLWFVRQVQPGRKVRALDVIEQSLVDLFKS